jgi:hypothetical protein
MLVLQLDVPTEPFWLDFPKHGVRVQVRPLTLAISAAIDSYARQEIAGLARERMERLASGAPLDDLPDWNDPHVRAGHTQDLVAVGMARYGIIAWDGVGDAQGAALPVTPDYAAAFARQMGQEFIVAYERRLLALAAEGNASGTGPAGASVPTANTATPASPAP